MDAAHTDGPSSMPKVTARSPFLIDAALIVLIAAISIAGLTRGQLDMITVSPWTGFGTVLMETGPAAIKVWTFWAVSAAIIAGLLLRARPALGPLDAAIGGLAGVWIFAYIGGNLLGPIGLLRFWTVWALLAVGAYRLWQSPPKLEWPPLSPGQRLVLLTCTFALPTLVILQLGSPVPPFMDIFATPAAAQRIITFGRYLPFSNDPYGYWDASSQLPGLELFYALLGIGSATSLGLLADTGAIVPMTVLFILGTYRLGKALAGDLVGGMATLFLFATILFRVMPFGHGRSTAFVLVAIGLAFFFDEERDRLRLTIAGLALATAVASHAIIGALGMATAAATVLLWIVSGEIVSALAAIGLLAGATIVALPTLLIGLKIVVPYPVLPAIQLVGIAVVWWSARWLEGRPMRDRSFWLAWLFALWAAYILLRHPSPFFPKNHPGRFPLLLYGAGVGLLFMVGLDFVRMLRARRAGAPRPPRPQVGAITMAIVVGIIVESVAERVWLSFPDPSAQTAIHDLVDKVDYWYPFVFTLPTAYLAAWLSTNVSRRATLMAVLLILFIPWRDHIDPNQPKGSNADPNYHQHSISEAWAYQLETGKRGYWGASGDRRWAQTPAELELAQLIRDEIAAGRITMDTHIVHVGPKILLYADNLLFPVYTGVNGDTFPHEHFFDRSIAGSRLTPTSELPARLATRPPYVAIHKDPLPLPPDALRGYSEIFNKDGVKLYRDDALMLVTRSDRP